MADTFTPKAGLTYTTAPSGNRPGTAYNTTTKQTAVIPTGISPSYGRAGASGTAPSGGGGGTPVSSSSPVQQQGPSQSDIDAAISDIYNSSNNYLNQAEGQVRADYPTVQQDIEGQYNTSKGQLDTSHSSNLAQFAQQTDQADYAHESALAAARRLYSELRQGYQQRFGGSTSAGDAANQMANVEQQRQEGQQNRGYQDTMTTINNKKDDTENQYQQGIQTLLTAKQTGLNQANRDFQNKLLQISQNRAANEQAKSQARLQALQDLRNQVFQINQQNVQFQQALEMQRAQSGQAVGGYGTAASGNTQAGAGAVSQYGSQIAPQSNLQASAQTRTSQPSYIGAINPQKKDEYSFA